MHFLLQNIAFLFDSAQKSAKNEDERLKNLSLTNQEREFHE